MLSVTDLMTGEADYLLRVVVPDLATMSGS
jgi:hypothetical protein